MKGFEFLNPLDSIKLCNMRNQAIAKLVGHPEYRNHIGDDQHDILGNLGPGHSPHTAKHRTEENTQKTCPDTQLERNSQGTGGHNTGTGDLGRHISEGCHHQNHDRASTGQVPAIAGADKVRHGVTAELAQVRCDERCHQHITACPADQKRHIGIAFEVDPAGHGDKRRTGHPVRRCGHAVEYGRDFTTSDVVLVRIHCSGKNADQGVDNDRESHKHPADEGVRYTCNFQNGHQSHEAEKS